MQPLSGSSMVPKQMTLNGHFGLKSVSGSATLVSRLRLSDKTVRKFEELYLYIVSDKIVARGT